MPSDDPQEIHSTLPSLLEVLQQAGFAEADIQRHLMDLVVAKSQTAQSAPQASKKHYLEQTTLIDGEDAFIYRRADTKRKLWYLRMYDPRDKKNIVRSLGTIDKSLARTKAIEIWSEVTQKIKSNHKIVSLTVQQLCDRYIKDEKRHLTDIPKQGITPGTLANKHKHLKKWQEFLDSLHLSSTPVDRIDPAKIDGDAFGKWLLSRPQSHQYKGPLQYA